MRFKPKKFVINPENPFEHDLLKRQEFILNIIELLKIAEDSLNIALTGKYGIGKTTTLEMLCCKARNDGFNTTYFNAWEHDYIDDPFSSILTEITNLLPSSDDVKDKLIDAGVNILKIGIPAIVKAATMNLIDLSDVTEEVISKITSEFASEELKKHLLFKKNIENFKKKLSNAVKLINTNGGKVLIVIDELDRCKPSYAVKLLEAMKHLFEIENLSFIIGLDYHQLEQSIAHVYGSDSDTNGYLRRFFDLQIELSQPNYTDYINYLFKSYDLYEIMKRRAEVRANQSDKQYFVIILSIFSEYYKASLRDIEKCFNIFSYVIASTEDNYMIFPAVLAYLIVLYLFDKELYRRFINNEVDGKEIAESFYNNKKLYGLLKSNDLNETYFIGELTITSFTEKFGNNPFEYHNSVIENDSADPKYKEYIREIKKSAENYQMGRRFRDVISYIENKMNFIDSIKNIST